MTRTIRRILLPMLIILMLVLVTPLSAQADGEEDAFTQTVNGYQVALMFAEDPAVGENQIHVQIHDAMDMPVGDAMVEVTLAPVAEEHLSEAQESSSHDDMPGMDMTTTEPSAHDGMSGMDMAEPATVHEASAHDEMQAVLLEPAHESGEYSGEMHIELAGEWIVRVHLTVQGEVMEVDFPLIVKSSSRNGLLAGFAGVNILILIVAAATKSKSASK